MVSEVDSASVYNDLKGLHELKTSARHKDSNALEKVAKQFESLFIQMVMKSMRAANETFSEDDMFNSEDGKFYQEMYDQQLSVSLGQGKGIGLADVLVKQLSPQAPVNKPNYQLEMPAKKMVETLNEVAKAPEAFVAPTVTTIKTEEVAAVPKKQKAPVFASPVDFVKAVWPGAIASAKKLGVDPKMLVAQAALETGWGKSIIQSHDGSSTHNLFNIKADKHQKDGHVAIPTIEYSNGVAVRRQENFKKYDSLSDSFSDYVGLLTQNDRYAKAINQASNPKHYIRSLQEGGYATDPNYADKVYKIYQSDVLHQALANIR